MTKIGSCFLALGLAACQPATTLQTMPTDWVLAEGLCDPETVIVSPVSDDLIVSNICEFKKNGEGYLSRISRDGMMIEEKWVTGLNAPAGMAADDTHIYVVDFDRVLKIDPADGSIVKEITPGREVGAFNDIALDKNGTLYISDSGKHKVIRFDDNQRPFPDEGSEFKYANGLHIQDDMLFVGSDRLWMIDLQTGGVSASEHAVLSDIDGIESDGMGGLVVSIVGGNIWHVPKGGEPVEYTAEGLSSTNHLYIPETRQAIVPTGFDDTIIAFSLKP